MKYIASQDLTEGELKRWATPRRLACASFYFWSGGSRLYKSMEGLLRSLLYQVFKSDSRLITKFCPRRAEIHQLLGRYSIPWTIDELEDTILQVPDDEEVKLFFLIDGLDECIDNHENLVRFLNQLTKKGNVKLCISSRPWQDFEDSYKDGPHLNLHELTIPDIRHFVDAKLNRSRGFADLKKRDKEFANSLVEEITLKSQGVFIWVQFVVRSILIDLKDGSLIEVINGRLRELPEDLEELFQKLLDMVEPSYKEVAHQIFRLVQASHAPMTLLTLSFAHEDGQASSVSKFGSRKLSLDEKEGRCNMMRRRLNSHCKGLLEVVPGSVGEADYLDLDDPNTGDSDPIEALNDPTVDDVAKRVHSLTRCTVQYMHRTVKDFLEKPTIWKSFNAVIAARSFDPFAALSRASLIQLMTMDLDTSTPKFFWGMVGDVLYYAALSEIESGKPLISELDELDKAADATARKSWLRGNPGNLIQRHMGTAIQGQKVPNRIQSQNEQRLHWSAIQATGGSTHSFLCLAVQYSLCFYVQAKLEAGSRVEQPKDSRSLLDCAIRDPKLIGTLEPPPLRFDRRLSMIKLLLAHGDDPNKVDALHASPWMYLESQIKNSNGPKRPKERRYSRVFVARSPMTPTKPQHSASPERLDFWISAAELFVENGANCWTADYKSLTEVFESFDKDRAMALKKSMKTRRFRPLQIWNLSIRRKSNGSTKVREENNSAGDKSAPDIIVLQVDNSATT
ncbi:hypothetical protein BDV96DRAFT_578838 [Lophiotrema nucula]|uniref:NACHT domain-containing protein n=1 Tax=Lophiotrema nucula TaxID=690887 RepID=A0A6A5Z2P8_9PLEO|nr:hypothetical protein BDV96DRAFT_578838 [Lophiotrema nucula]